MMTKCNVCFRHCDIKEGGLGFCKVRVLRDNVVVPENYGRITSIALDPIEKKPLHRFHPGTRILSVGSYGCNLRCPFCQNSDISWSDYAIKSGPSSEVFTPQEIADLALKYKSRGNIGVAFTYNEPLIAYEFVRDTAKLVHEQGMVNVLVTNGTAEVSVLEELAPYINAMNIDLKGFSDSYYSDVLGGSLPMVKAFISRAVQLCHVELTTLIVPGYNDTEEEMREITGFISSLTDASGNKIGHKIPLHISRFFPRFNLTDRDATPVKDIMNLCDIARESLDYVYEGNC
ncbi:MAG: AmmeMemoRadiSam system radical SAM enzyme [Clostridia bacterium]|nr:AmmeMemoRadiSam system radical SAM enzyme [Clostridia bacterium]